MRLPFLGRPTEMLAKELQRYNYRAGFYPVTRIRDLSTLKDKMPTQEKSGIYSLTCSCGDLYIGQTGRPLGTRLDEHKRAYLSYFKPKKQKLKTPQRKKTQSTSPRSNPSTPSKVYESDSAMARHCWTSGHAFSDVVPKLLHPAGKGNCMNRLEEWYTIQAQQDSTKQGFHLLNNMEAVFFNNFLRFYANDD